MEEYVVLVDTNDVEIGTMEKLEAHQKGVLHRAFSVLIFNNAGDMLLQRRALSKYHSAGLWTNACCSHPRKNETIVEAAKRRVVEEIGLKLELIESVFSFIYKAKFEDGLVEHELDHVLIAVEDSKPKINKDEVCDYTYKSLDWIMADMDINPEKYTAWFKILLKEHAKKIERAYWLVKGA